MTVKKSQVLEVEPKHELVFEGPFTDVVVSTIKLFNPLSEKVCFKVKTTVPKSYCVKPSSGVIEPLQELNVAVMLQPFPYDVNKEYKHKFMIQSLVVPDGVQATMEELWKETDPKSLMDSKLVCILRMPGELHIEPSKELIFEKSHALIKLHNQSSDHVCYKVLGVPPEQIVVDSKIRILPPGAKDEITVTAQCSDSETNKAKVKVMSMKAVKRDDLSDQQFVHGRTLEYVLRCCATSHIDGSDHDHVAGEAELPSDSLRKDKKLLDAADESSQVKALLNEIMILKKENAALREVDINLRRAALSDTCRIASEGVNNGRRRTVIADALTNTPLILFLFLALIAVSFLGKFIL